MLASYTRLYSDASGQSHFENLDIELAVHDFGLSAPPLYLSFLTNAARFGFFGAPAGWDSDWHPSSARNCFVIISGEWEVTVSDGETRRFGSGNVLLCEDTSGRGHKSRVTGDQESVAVLIDLNSQS